METVNSGKLLNAIKGFIGKLERAFKKLDMNITGQDIRDDGTMVLTIESGSEDVVKCKCVPIGNKLYNLYFKSPDNQQKEYDEVEQSDIVKKCKDVIDEWYGATTESVQTEKGEELLESTIIKLSKITSARQTKLKVDKIYGGFAAVIPEEPDVNQLSPEDILDAVNFVEVELDPDSIEEGWYELQDNVDDIELVPCPSCDETSQDTQSLLSVLAKYYELSYVSMYFSAKFSKEFNPSVLSFMDSITYCSQDKFRQFDTIVYNLSGCHIYPGAVAALCDNSCPLVDTPQNAIEYVRNMIDDIITAINLVYCNFEHDVQCLLDNDINELKGLLYLI